MKMTIKWIIIWAKLTRHFWDRKSKHLHALTHLILCQSHDLGSCISSPLRVRKYWGTERWNSISKDTELVTEVALEPHTWVVKPTLLTTVLFWGVGNALSQRSKKEYTQRGEGRKVHQINVPDWLSKPWWPGDDRCEKMASWPLIQREIENSGLSSRDTGILYDKY